MATLIPFSVTGYGVTIRNMAEDEVIREIGRRVRSRRERRELTQMGLAELVGISRSYVAQMENGKRAASFAVLIRVAEALDIPIEELLGGESGSQYLKELREDREAMRSALIDLQTAAATSADPNDPRTRLFLRHADQLNDEQWEQILKIVYQQAAEGAG